MTPYVFITLYVGLVYIYGLDQNNQQPRMTRASELNSRANSMPIPPVAAIPAFTLQDSFPKPSTDTESLMRLDRPTMGLKMYPPSDLGLNIVEAWDSPSSSVVVAVEGPLSDRTKAKLRVASLKRQGFSVKEGTLSQVHNIRIQRDYNPEFPMVNYPGGFHSVPLRDADGKPLPEAHIKAMLERVTPLDHSKVAGPYPGRYSTATFAGQAQAFSPYLQSASQMGSTSSHVSGVYLPQRGRYRTYRDQNTKGGATLVVWDPLVVDKTLTIPPIDMKKGSEHFRLLKEGGHQLWINAKQQAVGAVQHRAMEFASRGYRVYVYPEIPWSTEAVVPGHATRFPFNQPLPEGSSVSSRGGIIMPLIFVSFINGEFISKAPLWHGGNILPPVLAECVKDVMFYKPSKVIILDAAFRYWLLTGPNTAQILPGFKPESAMPFRPMSQHFSPGSSKGRGIYHDSARTPTLNQWGRTAVAGSSRRLPSGRYGHMALGKHMPVEIDGIFRDTNECYALSKYGANPTEFGLIPTLGGSMLYSIANNMTLKLRRLFVDIFVYRADVCLALRILIVMYDEMRNSLQCAAVLAAVINQPCILKSYQDQSHELLAICETFNFPNLPPITDRPIDLGFLTPKGIYQHFHLDQWPEVSSYAMRLDRTGSMRASAMQQAISQSELEFDVKQNVPSFDVVAAIVWMLDEKFLGHNSSAFNCGVLLKHIFTKHSETWNHASENDLTDICRKAGYISTDDTSLLEGNLWDSLFHYSVDGSYWREYLPVDDLESVVDFIVHKIFCKSLDKAGLCIATEYAKHCQGLPAYLVNRAQLMAFYAEKILLKNKASSFNVNTNNMCFVLYEAEKDYLTDQAMHDSLALLVGDFPSFVPRNSVAFWSSFTNKENKAMKDAHAGTYLSYYKTPKKFMSSKDAAMFQLDQEVEESTSMNESLYDD